MYADKSEFPLLFTGIIALFQLINCQRWDIILYHELTFKSNKNFYKKWPKAMLKKLIKENGSSSVLLFIRYLYFAISKLL